MLPPLKALVAFEAVGRHLSIKAAAQELGRTGPAVSQMVQLLEGHLGVKLFGRLGRGVTLTAVGQAYLPAVRSALRQIERSSRQIKIKVNAPSDDARPSQ